MERVNDIFQGVKNIRDHTIEPHEILTKIVSTLHNEPSLAIPLIEGLLQIRIPQTAWLLEQMRGITRDKDVLKTIKKGLYKLRQKGVHWDEGPRDGGSILHPLQRGVAQGYVGTMDSTGSMVIVVARARSLGGTRTYFSIVNDLEGVERFEHNDLSKRGLKEFMDRLLRSSGEFPIVEAPGDYCVHLLMEAAERSRKLAKAVPPGFRELQMDMQDLVWQGPAPLIYQYVLPETIEGQTRFLKESGNLHRVSPFTSWLLRPEAVQRYAKAIKEATESHLILTPHQRDARLNSIYMDALQGIFPDEKRLLWKRRLEEVAYVLWKTGREQDARLAVSAALNLKNPLNPIEPNPFVWNLMLKSISVQIGPHREKNGKEQQESFIVTP